MRNELDKTKKNSNVAYSSDTIERLNRQVDDLKKEVEQVTIEKEVQSGLKNIEIDKNLKLLREIDDKNEQILILEKDNLKKTEDDKLRREIVDTMSTSLLRHEQESRELAEKLTIMKNQIMETQVGRAIRKRFPAIKIGSLKSSPAFVFP